MAIQKLFQSEWPCLWMSIIAFGIFVIAIQKLFPRRRKLPPGPRGLPIVGNLLQLGNHRNHELLYDLATKYGPLMTLRFGTQLAVVATSPAMAEKVLKTHDNTLSGREFIHTAESEGHSQRNISMLQTGPRWRLLKKISITNLFSPKKLDSLRHLRRNQVDATIARFSESSKLGNSVNIQEAMSVCIFDLFAISIFSKGINSEEFEEYKHLVKEALSVLGLPNMCDYFPWLRWLDPQRLRSRADKALGKIYKVMEKALERRLEDPNIHVYDDLLSDFLKSRNEEFTNWDVVGLLSEMFIAGTETIGISVQSALAELMKNPSCMKKCLQEIDGAVGSKDRRISEEEAGELSYLKAVVKEAWRLHPPAPLLIPHRAQEDTVLDNEYLIPKNAQVIVNVWGIGRDPAVWKNPEKFYPERFITDHPEMDYKGQSYELLPFGSGRRICTGMPLATRMSFYLLASFLQCFEWSLPPSVHDVDMTEKVGNVVDKTAPLCLVPKPRLAAHVY